MTVPLKRAAETYIPLVSFTVFIFLTSCIFFGRSPVIFVSDQYFLSLYGEKRTSMDRLEASVRIARQVKLLYPAENSSNAAIAAGVESISNRPYAVFFLYAYNDAAKVYEKNGKNKGQKTGRIFVLLNKNPELMTGDENSSIVYVDNDKETDLYRAGRSAAVLAKGGEADSAGSKIVYVQDIPVSEKLREVFNKGLLDGSFNGDTGWVGNVGTADAEQTGCFVFDGASVTAGQNQTPVILFSWFSGENYLPDNVKVLFEDSPFYLIPEVLRAGDSEIRGNVIKIPGKFIVFKDRIADKTAAGLLSKIRRAVP